MIRPRKNKLMAQLIDESSIDREEKSFDFMNHYLKKFTQEITKDDGTQETIQLKSPLVTMRPDHCYSTLHEASIANDEKGIEKLLQLDEHKMWLNRFDINGQTPLQCAIDYSSDKAIICLIKNGAHADVSNQDGQYTAWTLAKAYFDSKIYTNVVPFMTLQHALMLSSGLQNYYAKRKRAVKEENTAKMPVQNKPSKIIYLKRRIQKETSASEYDPGSDEQEYDPYLLNV